VTIRSMFLSLINSECNIHLSWLCASSNISADLLSKGNVALFRAMWTGFSEVQPLIPPLW
jgi:hypothetical protein